MYGKKILYLLAMILSLCTIAGIYADSWVLDTSFNPGTSANGTILSMKLRSGNKIIIGGLYTNYNGTSATNIARINFDGSFDTGFIIGSGFDERVYSVNVLSDDKILLVGRFVNYAGFTANRIIRLNTDGTFDTGFNMGSGFNNIVYNAVVQPDDKIVAVGYFTNYRGTTVNRIVRLNADGTIDTGFNVGGGFNNGVEKIALQSDGKIVVGGFFTAYSGTTTTKLARLNTDGTIDTGFNVGSSVNNLIEDVAVQSDNKVLVAGYFTSYSGTAVNRIVRLNEDGTFDTGFNVGGSGFNNITTSLFVQTGNKILVGGYFTNYNGTSVNRFLRLNEDGTFDTGFNVGGGFNNYILNTNIQSDDKIVVAGAFVTYSGVSISRIARLEPADVVPFAYDLGGPILSVNPQSLQYSSGIVVTGINTRSPIIATGAFYSVNTGAYTGSIGEVGSGDFVRLQLTSAGWYGQIATGYLSIGGLVGSFFSTTLVAGAGVTHYATVDDCPDGDYSPTMFDNDCGMKPGTQTGSQTGTGVDSLMTGQVLATGDNTATGSVLGTGVSMGTGSQKETTEIDFSGTLNCSDNTLNEAYMFSRRYKITTKPDCLSAAMDQPLARRDAAKMISNLAMNVYHRRPDKTKLCIFADMLDMDPEYQHYATTACQLGLMGIYDINAGAMNFYPDEYVDKAQFATMVSRMLYGSRYNEFSADRYQRHIQTLSDRGVLDSTADLFSPLPRGGAMLILMRL